MCSKDHLLLETNEKEENKPTAQMPNKDLRLVAEMFGGMDNG